MPLRSVRSSWATIFCSILLLGSARRIQQRRHGPKIAAAHVQDEWPKVHVGPLTVDTGGILESGGIVVKPQFKVGVEADNYNAQLGVSDVRDGLQVLAKVGAKVYAESEALTVQDLDDNIRCDTPGFNEALEVAKEVIQAGGAGLDYIAAALHVDKSVLDQVWHGDASDAEHLMKLRVKASVSIGASASVSLGWEDTKGYHMVGAGGKASALLSLGCSIFVGKHKDGTSLKVILGISNFGFEYTMPINPEHFNA